MTGSQLAARLMIVGLVWCLACTACASLAGQSRGDLSSNLPGGRVIYPSLGFEQIVFRREGFNPVLILFTALDLPLSLVLDTLLLPYDLTHPYRYGDGRPGSAPIMWHPPRPSTPPAEATTLSSQSH